MTDLQQLKAQHDLRLIVEADLGPSRTRGGKAMMWRCPFHHEQKGESLAVWADGWRCFGACGEGGDVLDWLERYRGLTFQEACETLGQQRIEFRNTHRSITAPRPPMLATPPDRKWQKATRRVVQYAVEKLWSPAGVQALAYLRGRGLTSATIQDAQLGLISGQYWEWLTICGLSVPCGITIPWFIGDDLWAVKVRRFSGIPKYTQIPGGSANGLYNADKLEWHDVALLVEGEFDALLAEQECGGQIAVGTLGSASLPLNSRWLPVLATCKVVLVAYDNDDAGQKGTRLILTVTHRAKSITVPYGKDITEFVMQGGSIKQWLTTSLGHLSNT